MAHSTDLFDYTLPPELIAQTPAPQRAASRLLVVDRSSRRIDHRQFRELPEIIEGRYAIFRNNASVIPARLFCKRPSGGNVECFLLRPTSEPSQWWCLLRPGRKLPPGSTFGIDGVFAATVLEKDEAIGYRVSFAGKNGRSVIEIAREVGEVPLPPYIERTAGDAEVRRSDRERYATVYADSKKAVAVAAPTAGMHFTPEILAQLEKRGATFHDLTLHVGLGTFRPIQTATVEEHPIHREIYEMPSATQRTLVEQRGRRLAIGTTSLRSIEDFLEKHPTPPLRDCIEEASIYIVPPRKFRGVDALLTNFHQPRSTLMCLVSAFLTPGSDDGIDWIQEIYAEAIRERYRFFSYGDAMLIL